MGPIIFWLGRTVCTPLPTPAQTLPLQIYYFLFHSKKFEPGKLEEKTKRLEDRHFWKRCMQLQSATGTDAMCAPNFSADKSIAAAITVNHSRLLFKSSFPDRISTLEPKA